MDITTIKRIYFVGIGGIGMSALARYFNSKGVVVSGYDKTATILTEQLSKEGIKVHYEDNVGLIDKEAQLVVYTPAVPADHKELNYYRDNKYEVVKRSDVLGAITTSSFNICVAGTHGKTTTSTMVAHILRDSGYGCNAFLGGIAANYNSNFWSSENNVCVVEADEYDRSFLKLSPDVAIITAMDADHLDIYGTAESVEQAFIDFSSKIKPGGLLVSKFGLSRGNELKGSQHLHYGVNENNADVCATNIKIENGSYRFDVVMKEWTFKDVVLNMGGMHNIENVTAAITVAHHLKIDDEKIKAAVSSFKGVKRRFEYILKNDSTIFIDDYAHHPEELRALLSGATSLFKDKKCTVIFQPHLYTRTRDFANEFSEVLALADEVILLPIYPARELPIEGVNSEMIVNKIAKANKSVKSKEELLDWVKNNKRELVITAGAGDIDTLVEPIKQLLKN
ncbi:UDP-N-acetylmuramate--L-alanine ligase [Ferruginibacter albus]|uniref:UDP-N-acetylmuramate--L-alanine ligase n=1 Tax=Ferruginibacter albus TaxID=2875540 RepID=UPI001CC772E7|nr:UDP-N-acetylmuramate--L-alanine ligase [Ferruginibacter albus]UAY51642.1 UDP-N-acetylmuramate--L-alanine ligase [Ferruginibacter albus]